MGLYTANLESVAQPVVKKGNGKKKMSEPEVEEPAPVVEKKKRVKKVKILEPVAEPVLEPVEINIPVVKKKKATKKVAVDEKAKKEEEEEKAKVDEQAKALLEKKALAAEKRRKRKATAEEDKLVTLAIEAAVQEDPKPKKQKSDEPPKWFKKYIEGVAVEQNSLLKDKKPKTEVKRHADEVAERSWRDGFTRDRVQTEVDGHMDRMYQMMFARKLK